MGAVIPLEPQNQFVLGRKGALISGSVLNQTFEYIRSITNASQYERLRIEVPVQEIESVLKRCFIPLLHNGLRN